MLVEETQLNKTLETLKSALDQVETKYIVSKYDRNKTGLQKPESSFGAELYHQLRMIQNNNSTYSNLKFQVDISKKNYSILNSKCLEGLNKNRMKPDLVLHQEQNKINEQKLVCEIKLDYGNNIYNVLKDLKKLVYYKISNLKFENAVLIIFGSMEQIEKTMEKINILEPSFVNDCLYRNKILFCLTSNRKVNENKKNSETWEWSYYKIEISNK
jgi:hypothetical protein